MVVAPDWGARRRLLLRARRRAPATLARADGGWLVVAPHPDDETLGAGGLIAALTMAGVSVTVAILTDGAASHVGAPRWSARRIAAVRAAEAGAALRALGLERPAVRLGWSDAAPFVPGSDGHAATLRRLVALCRRHRIRHIVASWGGDPHCDHEAAAGLAAALARTLRVRPLYYPVWGWTVADLDLRLRPMRALAVPVARWRGRQRRALACHRTQLGGRIAGAGTRFVLPRSMRRLVDGSHTLLLEPRDAS